MRICPSCGRESPDEKDFCECGEYLRWEPTQFIRAVPPGPVESPPGEGETAPTEERPTPAGDGGKRPAPAARARGAIDPVTIELHAPDRDSAPGDVASARTRPGEVGSLRAVVRNQSGIVDNYELRVEGLDPGWWSVDPETTYLVPFGSAGTYEDEVEIRFHPPRSADAEARSWDLEIVVVSKAEGGRVVSAPAKLVVDPFEEVEVDVRPRRRRARLGARFALTLRNRANAPVELELGATDRDQALRYRFTRERVELAPGERKPNRLTVRPRRQRWFGSSAEHGIELAGTPAGAEEAVVTREATFVQKPWFPRWLLIAVPIVLAFALLLWLLLPSNTEVPDVTEAGNLFEAQQLLDEAELTLSPQPPQERTVRGERIGTILDQTPAAGEEVEEGSEVTVQLGVGSGTVEVPDVEGISVAEAAQVLGDEDLMLGAVQPQPEDPATATIATQTPAAGEEAAVGSPVDAIVVGGEDGDGGEEVPEVEGSSPDEAAAAVADAGLAPEIVHVIDDSEPGTLVGTEPAAGTAQAQGTPVRILVSAGFPDVAVDDTEDVTVLDGTSGEEVATVAATDDVEEQPAWSPDGEGVAYRRDGRIALAARDGSDERLITPEDEDFGVPAFAPTEDELVLAAIRRDGDDGDLCLIAVPDSGDASPRCIRDPDLDLIGGLSWAPDGSSLLAFGGVADSKDGQGRAREFGLVRYASEEPFATDRESWGEGELVTEVPDEGQGVISGAFSPDGERLAVVANFRPDRKFRVLVTEATDFELRDAESTGIQGCEALWRADGEELLIAQRDCDPGRATTSDLVRVDPRSPDTQQRLGGVSGVAHPAWQPLPEIEP